MEIKYVPSLAKGEDAKFEGCVVLRMPTFDEKYKYIEECAKVDESESDSESVKNLKKLKQVRVMVALSEPHYIKVDLKLKDGSKKYKSFSDLSYSDEAHPIMIEVASKIMSGGLGNG